MAVRQAVPVTGRNRCYNLVVFGWVLGCDRYLASFVAYELISRLLFVSQVHAISDPTTVFISMSVSDRARRAWNHFGDVDPIQDAQIVRIDLAHDMRLGQSIELIGSVGQHGDVGVVKCFRPLEDGLQATEDVGTDIARSKYRVQPLFGVGPLERLGLEQFVEVGDFAVVDGELVHAS